MRMVVAGGGTGGHLFPGIAVAEAWVKKKGGEVLFVGSAYGLEAKILPEKGYRFVGLSVKAARGRGWQGWLEFVRQFPVALLQSRRVLGKFSPAVVVGLGSYGSVPVIVAARSLKIPIVLLEQNARPGLANRFLGHLATKICTAFAEAQRFFPEGKSVHTGNPVRALLPSTVEERSCSEGFHIFAFGGSQGARSINRAMVGAAHILQSRIPSFSVTHQTGSIEAEWVKSQYESLGVVAEVHSFIEDMASAYARADLVVCRAGATTLAELASVGKPAILVPYPFAADDHQRANAEVWVREGAAEMILDRELSGEVLAAKVAALAADPERRQALARNALRLARPQAAEQVVRVCEQVRRER